MKKIILAALLAGSIISFSGQGKLRTVEKCKITSKGISNGKRFVNCQSLQSGKTFNFTSVHEQTFSKFSKGYVFKVYFFGKGYNNLTLDGFDFISEK